jgi:hypothetical protein
MNKEVAINRELAIRVLSVVDKGLCQGLGKPVEGQMCIEAAVNYAMGLPHGDNPSCVSPAVRALKIRLNDKNWSSNKTRAKGMRRLAIAQLGTAGHINDVEFVKAVAQMTIQKIVPRAFRSAARIAGKVMKALLEEWALNIEKEPTQEICRKAVIIIRKENANAAYVDAAAYAAAAAATAADAAATAATAAATAADDAAYAAAATAAAADAAAYAAAAAARDKELSFFAEEVVQILVVMKAQGTEWLDLTDAA